MQEHVRKRGNSWLYIVQLGRGPLTCKRKITSKSGFTRKKDCEKAMNTVINQIENVEFFQESEITLGEYLLKRRLIM